MACSQMQFSPNTFSIEINDKADPNACADGTYFSGKCIKVKGKGVNPALRCHWIGKAFSIVSAGWLEESLQKMLHVAHPAEGHYKWEN